MTPKKPVVGVIGSAHTVEGKFTAQRVGERNLRAVAETAGALPLMFAGTPEITDIGALLDTVDGILLTGARANVHPSHFGHEENAAHEPYDRGRDAIALSVIEGVAEDGTIEAIRIADAPGFALGVQWHAEYEAKSNWINRALFQAFGEALAAHRKAA